MMQLNVYVRRVKDREYDEWESRALTQDGLMELATGVGGSRREAVERMMYLLEEQGD